MGTYPKKIVIVGSYQKKIGIVGTSEKIKKNLNYGNISIFKKNMGTYINFDNSELWEHIQSELWHLSFGIMGSFRED
jgi:hypothetical protein